MDEFADDEPDDLDEIVWELNHVFASSHWAWRWYKRLCLPGQWSWNGWLRAAAMRLDPPPGAPVADEPMRFPDPASR